MPLKRTGPVIRRIALVGLLAGALALRAMALTSGPFWLDEAESAINALSILERGYPGSEHLGVPIYENMLVRPWPGHPEYEFKDISYSDRGYAVYHGWLPLAAIAASFAVFGVQPPALEPGWTVRIDEAAWKYRTLAGRVPSVIFAALFLVVMFRAGEKLAGWDAGLAVLILAGFSSSLFDETIHARYHALTLALTAAAVLPLWRIAARDRWRDYSWHAVVLVLLFHTNALACVTVVIVTILVSVVLRRTRHALLYLAASGVIVIAGILPWVLLTGYIQHMGLMPAGRTLLHVPGDLWLYASERIPYLWAYSLGLSWSIFVMLLHGRGVPEWIYEPWERHSRQYLLLITWMAVAVVAFGAFTPAASVFPERLSLQLFIPGLLLLALLFTDVARGVTRSQAAWVAPALAAGFLAAGGLLAIPLPRAPGFGGLAATFDALNGLRLPREARVYASPDSYMVLMFYGERPFRSIAPVRKTFLDEYPGDVVYIESRFDSEFARPDAAAIRAAAAGRGLELSVADADAWAQRLVTRYPLETVRPLVREVAPPLDDVPPFVTDAMEVLRASVERDAAQELQGVERTPIFRGFRLRTKADIWQVFFYRLVDPASRSGAHFNAAARLANGQARLVPEASTVIFHSPEPVGPRARP